MLLRDHKSGGSTVADSAKCDVGITSVIRRYYVGAASGGQPPTPKTPCVLANPRDIFGQKIHGGAREC